MRDVSATGSAPRPKQTRGSPHHTLSRDRLEEASVSHSKTPVISARFAPADLHILDSCRRRTPFAPGDEGLDLLFRTLGDCLDLARRQVAHFAGETEPARLVLGARALENPLHDSGNDDLRARHFKSSRKPFSSTTRTPSSCAFFSLLPASSPATSRSVLRLIDPETRPPRRSISALASSRVY